MNRSILREGRLRTSEGIEAKRARDRARSRAERELARRHESEYRRLLEAELVREERAR